MPTLPRDIPTDAPSAADDDYVQIDGATNKSRKFLAKLWAVLASPVFTGTPTAPTPDGTAPKALTTVDYVATPASVNVAVAAAMISLLQSTMYPVGEILVTRRTGTPSSWLGFGTWVNYGAGRVLVGVAGGDPDFGTIDQIGGAKTHTLVSGEIPGHTHSFSGSGTTSVEGGHTHYIAGNDTVGYTGDIDAASVAARATNIAPQSNQMSMYKSALAATVGLTSTGTPHTHTVTVSGTTGSAGGGAAHNNLQPYITVVFWKRVA